MPSETKRKRGRPSNASKSTTVASQDPPEEYEADVEEETRPRKRGRPKKSPNDVPEIENDVKNKGRGRGRHSQSGEPGERDEVQPEEQPKPKRKRGRPSLEKRNEQGAENDNDETSQQKESEEVRNAQPEEIEIQPTEAGRRKRGRKPARKTEPEAPEEPQSETRLPTTKRKRGRPSLNKEEDRAELPEQEKPRRRGRPSLQDVSPDDAQNKTSKESQLKSKRGRKESAAQETAAAAHDNAPTKPRRTSGRPSLSRKEKPEDANREDENDASQTSRRRSTNNDEPPPSPEKPYLHIVSKTRRIRPSTINDKWSPLAGPSVPAVSSILELAHVPVLQRISHTQNRRTHATNALTLVTNRIMKKLEKGIPFPPVSAASISSRTAKDGDGGRETELDFEAVLDARGFLERQLVPGLQAVELLKRERDRMESELERDYDRLSGLEAGARGQVREKRDLLKKAHVLAPSGRTSAPDDDGVSKPEPEVFSGNIFKNPDETLGPLSLQLGDHIDSIRTNLSQAHGIVPQIAHTRAALQDLLFRYLEEGAYESVVHGPS